MIPALLWLSSPQTRQFLRTNYDWGVCGICCWLEAADSLSSAAILGICLGMVPYLSAYVWWTADSTKNSVSSLFIGFRCGRKESLTELRHWISVMTFLSIRTNPNSDQHTSLQIKIPWPKFWSYISFVSTLWGGWRDRISHSHAGLKLTM